MQETLLSSKDISAEARSIARFSADIERFGVVAPETSALVRDEEKTHAAEIVAQLAEASGVIPRVYEKAGEDLKDKYGQSLQAVLDAGLTDIEKQEYSNKPGAAKEKQRRLIEKKTLADIVNLPVGVACVESSPTDLTWTDAEQKEQGYCGDTLLRITAHVENGTFLQANVVLKTSDLRVINQIREFVSPGSEPVDSAEGALKDFQNVAVNAESFKVLVRSLERQAMQAQAELNPSAATAAMLKQYIEKRRDVWEFINHEEQDNVFDELVEEFETQARKASSAEWSKFANLARAGAWQELCDRFEGRKANDKGSIITNGQKRAAAIQRVFVACGGKVDTTELIGGVSAAARAPLAMSLKNRYSGIGTCLACYESGDLFGCGVFCQGCNTVWCEEYATSGRELEPGEVIIYKYLQYARP